jgi:hypothetical protein
MNIIVNIQNNIVVIHEIKSFYVTLAAGKFFPNNIHQANYHFTHSKNLKKTGNTTVLPLGGIVYRKRPLFLSPSVWQNVLAYDSFSTSLFIYYDLVCSVATGCFMEHFW